MDLIVELIKAIVAAFEEAQGKKRKPAPDTLPGSEPAVPPPDHERTTRAAQQRVLEKQQALLLRHREAEAAQQRPSPRAPVEPPRIASRPTGAQRLGRLLRQPNTVRELILLSEIIGPPKSLRRGRR